MEQMAICNSEIVITDAPFAAPPNDWKDSVGGVVDFWGVVRGLEGGEEITGIEYEAHRPMAQHQLEKIAEKAQAHFEVKEIILRHRVGFVAASEASLFLRVTSGHREAAFRASQWIVAELKQEVPIWKKPLFVQRNHGKESQSGSS